MTFTINSTLEMANSVKIPIFGLGTYLLTGNQGQKAIECALKVGYRLIDTATLYNNEKIVGNALKNTKVPRDQVFITSKVWNSDQGYSRTLNAFNKSLSNLGVDFLDLYLIHWPVEGKWKDTWHALEELYIKGKVRAIGVSNFYISHLEELLKIASIKPMVNQIEFHPFLYKKDILEYCQEKGIVLESYAPLTHGYKINDIKSPQFLQLIEKYNKSAAQIMLRWNIQLGNVIIPKSINPSHIKENAEIFDFTISVDDMHYLDSFNEDFHSDWDPSD
ncbi:aldo/keto reductase [Promethearchaeum syntrophicum]|uniref:Aldo/keto reductase n=1 Tax=Promethearchaeum syntrophicum TaxID=2594042 RepID=A0A5B9DCF1_9ARCH|nr:aldo/keto reductase [Candidatus Prometheoarchaeum syntrophicum]QEE16979.1 2,5-diketo-D-gluconate reductase A [Candidatus Prometheoarchaeum syntrophicum]